MRKLDIGMLRSTEVNVLDEPGESGACHVYAVTPKKNDETATAFCRVIIFQNGPIKENGVNGCQQEDLIAICIDRLRSFQAGEFACPENKAALINLEGALEWLNARTLNRQNRGVEGSNQA
jgi:hypothetical protein